MGSLLHTGLFLYQLLQLQFCVQYFSVFVRTYDTQILDRVDCKLYHTIRAEKLFFLEKVFRFLVFQLIHNRCKIVFYVFCSCRVFYVSTFFLFSQRFYRAALNADAMRNENSVRLSVCLSNACIVTKRKICLELYIIRKNIYPSFLRRRIVGGGRPLLPEILGQLARVRAKSPILNQ